MLILCLNFTIFQSLNEVVELTQILFGLLQFTEMFITHPNLNEPLLLYQDLSNSTQVGMKLFQLPKLY